jgi:hypothetical protein
MRGADWHLGDLDDLSDFNLGDPMEQIRQLQSEGTLVDLNRSAPDVSADLQRSILKEGRMSSQAGIECDLKWEPGHYLMGGSETSCRTCPFFTENPERPLSVLCRIGREQEDLVSELHVIQGNGSLDDELWAAYSRDMDAVEELVQAAAV